MKHGISFIPVDNSLIQEAIALKKPKDDISYLKQQVSYSAVYGFQYDEVEFSRLGNILTNDYGFNPFKYKNIEEGAIYNKDKHPDAWGRIRGRENTNGKVSWICLDVDDTTITDNEMHSILRKLNHHIARTSDRDNPYKYRVILELSRLVSVDILHWKPFIKSIANTLGIKVDNLGPSQVFYGYLDRQVYSVLDQDTLDPSTHLEIASMKVVELEEKRATALPPGEADAKLQKPFNTFLFAYDAESGEGTNKLLAAIHLAKELGASRDYCVDLINSINNFWDHPMPKHRLDATVMTAI